MEERKSFNIPIARPYFGGQEASAIDKLLKRGWVTQGPMVAQFEQAVAGYVDAKYAVATSSCTAALHLSMLVNGIGDGDDVLCPSYTFIATANAIKHAGAQPQFLDINAGTLAIDAGLARDHISAHYDRELQNKITGNKLKAIVLVHQLGIAGDIDALTQLCTEFGITLIEDSACALGSSYKGKPIGGSGNLNCLSFHPRKVITTGEGGMMLTNDHELSERARRLRAHGASTSDLVRHQSSSPIYETYDVVGYNYRMTDIQAAIGIKQLELLDWIVEQRIDIGARYDEAFSGCDWLGIITAAPYQTSWNRQSYPIRINNGGQQTRDQLMAFLQQRGIATRRGIPPIHLQAAYAGENQKLPITEAVANSSLFLPLFTQMTEAEVEHVIASVFDGIRSQSLTLK